ncbi:hypothetical protein [Halalkalibacter akibai]|uniref:Uncharacterized protein n=1 Tax=Halalkalibacter akibai (strain ATCC 43226 / DSM 21942 / CIP 109018 / JCM 9157 / 1139) TaxID=1236973 RepID=W4R0I2_HALA3|nr:hypothetical protein [Halalkalibacter akibai]GAE37064.1 hypothetical protein JCM9157_4307 [Halalkalibacter akibai JCM 9157]
MKKLNVTEIQEKPEGFVASVKEELNVELARTLKAGNRMLVDSDGLAFIYIIEDELDYYYVSFGKGTWPSLKKLLANQGSLDLELGNSLNIELTAIADELAFLTENIEGNSNYGEEMEKAVSDIFL